MEEIFDFEKLIVYQKAFKDKCLLREDAVKLSKMIRGLSKSLYRNE
jgi:hypothetical protein